MKKKNGNNITQDILFYARKLPPVRQIEALDYIRWLWVSDKSAGGCQVRFDKLLKRVRKNARKNSITEQEIDDLVEEVRAERYAKGSH
jgi:hypothetical protein